MNKSGKQQKKVYVYTKDFKLLLTFPSTAECARELNLSQGNIVLCCQGVLKSYKGMYFSYTPLLTKEDIEQLHQQGQEKRDKRDEQISKAQKKYGEAHKDKLNEMSLRYYYKNRQRILQYQKERYHKLKDEGRL